jgi:tRNA(Ile)-lysidine synthase
MSKATGRSDGSVLEAVRLALRGVQHDLLAAPSRPVIVAFSGGLDSTVLLEACTRIRGADGVIAIHVHHGLQPAAEAWAEHCGRQAAERGVRFECIRLEASSSRGEGLEAWARRERYRALWAAVARRDAVGLLTAHQADDLAETLLMRLARGAGLDGLVRALPACERGPEGAMLLRPLLGVSRAELFFWARQMGLVWIDDPMNEDAAFTRVRTRAQVMPALEAVEPGAVHRLARAQALLADAAAELDQLAIADLARAREGDLASGSAGVQAIDRRALLGLSAYRQAQVLRLWWRELAGGLTSRMPSEAQADEWRSQMIDAQAAQAHVRLADWLFVRYRDRVEAWPADDPIARAVWMRDPAFPQALTQVWDGQSSIFELADWGARLHVTASAGGRADQSRVIQVQHANGEQVLRLRVDGPSRSTRKIWQARGVPPALRGWLPLVRIDGQPAFLAGIGLLAGAGDAGWRFKFEPCFAADPRALFCSMDSI